MTQGLGVGCVIGGHWLSKLSTASLCLQRLAAACAASCEDIGKWDSPGPSSIDKLNSQCVCTHGPTFKKLRSFLRWAWAFFTPMPGRFGRKSQPAKMHICTSVR